MKKKINVPAIVSIFFLVVVLLIRSNKKQSSVAVPEITLVYAENQVEDYPTSKGAYEFARLVNEKTNGRIKIVVKCNGELGDEKSVIEQLKFGGVDFSRVSISSISDDIPALKVIQMPFLYSDGQEMFDVLNGEDGMQFIDEIEESSLGVRALSWYDAGANPVKMSYSEVYKGFQTGKIDGAENSLVAYTYSKHYEQAKYCLVDEHTRIPEVQLVSQYTWSKLSDDDKMIITECAKESAVYERNIWNNTEKEAVNIIKNEDITVTKVSDEERQSLRGKLQPIYDKYCTGYNDMIEKNEKE